MDQELIVIIFIQTKKDHLVCVDFDSLSTRITK